MNWNAITFLQTPTVIRTFMNLWPPYLGTGIHIQMIASDFRRIEVVMRHHWYNSNYVGTHFGGSLYAMTDPFYMLMLMNILGRDYLVWDKGADISFDKPGRGTLKAVFVITDEQLDKIRSQTDHGEKFFYEATVLVQDEQGDTVATVKKIVYIRRKPHKRLNKTDNTLEQT